MPLRFLFFRRGLLGLSLLLLRLLLILDARSRRRCFGAVLRFAFFEKFEERGAAGVAQAALSALDDPRVSTRTFFESRPDHFEEFVDDLLVIVGLFAFGVGLGVGGGTQARNGKPAGVKGV